MSPWGISVCFPFLFGVFHKSLFSSSFPFYTSSVLWDVVYVCVLNYVHAFRYRGQNRYDFITKVTLTWQPYWKKWQPQLNCFCRKFLNGSLYESPLVVVITNRSFFYFIFFILIALEASLPSKTLLQL